MLASELLQMCIDDIDNGKWICGLLDDWKGKPGSPNSKHMGCAIGLVAINSGHTEKHAFAKHQIAKYISTDSDLAPKEAKNAVKYLNDSIPEDLIADSRNKDILGLEGNVVDYNDSTCKTPADAKKWFSDALELAKKDEADPALV